MKIEIMRLTETAKIPTKGTVDAAGYDLYADMSNVKEDKRKILYYAQLFCATI